MPSNFNARDAAAYEQVMGRWSRRLAPLFIDFAGVGEGERLIDVGCGTGSLAFALLAGKNPAALTAVDYSELYLKAARAAGADPRLKFEHADACPLHNWTIGLVDGCASAPDVGCAQRFSVRVEDGTVALDLAELAHPQADADPGTASQARGSNDAAAASVESPGKTAAAPSPAPAAV